MDKEFQNLDYIKEFFLNSTVEISLNNFVVAIIMSTILAFVIKKVYIYSSQSLSNKEYFSCDSFKGEALNIFFGNCSLLTVHCSLFTVLQNPDNTGDTIDRF